MFVAATGLNAFSEAEVSSRTPWTGLVSTTLLDADGDSDGLLPRRPLTVIEIVSAAAIPTAPKLIQRQTTKRLSGFTMLVCASADFSSGIANSLVMRSIIRDEARRGTSVFNSA